LIDRIDVTNEKTSLRLEFTPKDEAISSLYSGFSLLLAAGKEFEHNKFSKGPSLEPLTIDNVLVRLLLRFPY